MNKHVLNVLALVALIAFAVGLWMIVSDLVGLYDVGWGPR